MFVYASHLGGFILSEELLEFKEVYCEDCGGVDVFIGVANTKDEARELTNDLHGCMDDEDYEEILEECFGEQGESEV